MTNNSLLITLEGIEGVGKSTTLQFLSELLDKRKRDYEVTREPGGTPVGEAIRQVLLTEHDETMTGDTELLLFFAARAEHIATKITPALAAGKIVICDRFIDASYAYQGGGRGVAMERIQVLEAWLQPQITPDLTLLLDAPVDVGVERMSGRTTKDRIESEKAEFFDRVRKAYLQRAEQFPQRYRIVDATQDFEGVKQQVQKIVEPFFHDSTVV